LKIFTGEKMTLLDSVLMGALQGLTEFLPVSSSGHLAMARLVLDVQEIPLLFDVLLHVATLVAVVLVFRKRIWAILSSLGAFIAAPRTHKWKTDENLRLLTAVIIASVFTAAVGLALSHLHVESTPRVVSALFIVTGCILILSRFAGGTVDYSSIGVKHALITGVSQGIGVLPGISRSGITISAGLYSGMNREKAGEYAFILSIPAILGALILLVRDAEQLSDAMSTGELLVGVVTAFAVGLLSLLLLLKMLRAGKLYLFSIYLIPLGIVGLILI
jgi:undecaprenyl-diphosphatase